MDVDVRRSVSGELTRIKCEHKVFIDPDEFLYKLLESPHLITDTDISTCKDVYTYIYQAYPELTYSKTPVMIAATFGLPQPLALMIEHPRTKDTLDCVDRNGWTAVMIASDIAACGSPSHHSTCIHQLLSNDASATIKDPNGQTALDIVKSYLFPDDELIELLEAAVLQQNEEQSEEQSEDLT